jgi:Calx-beta domain-containing protein
MMVFIVMGHWRARRALMVIGASAICLGEPAAAACAATSHARAKLDGFTANVGLQSFYAHIENEAQATFRVRNVGDDCVGTLLTASYATKDVTTTANVDYSAVAGQTQPLNDEPHPEDNPAPTFQDVNVPIINNDDQPVVESVQISVSVPAGAALSEPSAVPLYIVDDDGATRLGLDSYPYAQSETVSGVEVPVFRAGTDVSGTAAVTYSFGPGAQSPATPGQDFQSTPGTVSFQPNERWKLIPLTILEDSVAEPAETLQISLQGAGVVPAVSMTTFTILDNEEGNAPSSKLHHPRHRWRYPYNDYRIREIHVFTKDELGGSGVIAVELALRRRLTNGKCAWWNGKRFRGGNCSEKLWRSMKVYEPGYFYYLRLRAIAPSVGTRVMNYTAYARATDGAGNVESLLQQRRNRNTFEVKQRTG